MAVERTTREKLEGRLAGLQADRQPFEADWSEIARLAMAQTLDVNSTTAAKNKRASNTKLQDTGGLLAGRTLTNGIAQGMSSSASPWFKLAPRDRDMLEYGPVKEWLADVERVLYGFFNATNYYDASKRQYRDLGHLGTGVMLGLEHDKYLGAYHPLRVGTYWLEQDDGLRASSLWRKGMPTVKELVDTVRDWNKLTPAVKRLYDKCDYGTRVPIMHVIEPNEDAYGKPLSPNIKKPYRSIRWEMGQNDKSILLSEQGFDSQPFSAVRWDNDTDTAYSDNCPGFEALADLRELQLAAKRGGRAMDGVVKPPMGMPANLARQGVSLDPGTITYLEHMAAESYPRELYKVPYQSLDAITGKIDWLTNRIERIFYADLFMAITNMEGVQPRNEQELFFRKEEQLTQLGGVVDRVNVEKLEYDIDRAYAICKNLGFIPPPPPEMEGQAMTVDFISILARAQKASENTAIERAARFVGFLAGFFPDAAIKFDAEEAIDQYATNTGTNPKIIRTDQVVKGIREQQAAAQQQQQMMEAAGPMKDMAGAAELLSRTQVTPDGETALQRMVGQ